MLLMLIQALDVTFKSGCAFSFATCVLTLLFYNIET
jgi:hypothetical protein